MSLTKKDFNNGFCDAFALALHDLTDLPFGIWRYKNKDNELGLLNIHTALIVKHSPLIWLDVDGEHYGLSAQDFPDIPLSGLFHSVNLDGFTSEKSADLADLSEIPVNLVLEEVSIDEVRTAFRSYEIPNEIQDAKNLIANDTALMAIIAKYSRKPVHLLRQ
jgi:hypothetical protein